MFTSIRTIFSIQFTTKPSQLKNMKRAQNKYKWKLRRATWIGRTRKLRSRPPYCGGPTCAAISQKSRTIESYSMKHVNLHKLYLHGGLLTALAAKSLRKHCSDLHTARSSFKDNLSGKSDVRHLNNATLPYFKDIEEYFRHWPSAIKM